jgi:hypothetical protein
MRRAQHNSEFIVLVIILLIGAQAVLTFLDAHPNPSPPPPDTNQSDAAIPLPACTLRTVDANTLFRAGDRIRLIADCNTAGIRPFDPRIDLNGLDPGLRSNAPLLADENRRFVLTTPVLTDALNEGNHTLFLRINKAPTEFSISVVLDKTPPRITMTSPAVFYAKNPVVSFRIDENISGIRDLQLFELKYPDWRLLDQNRHVDTAYLFAYTAQTSGTHRFRIVLTDNAGNISTTEYDPVQVALSCTDRAGTCQAACTPTQIPLAAGDAECAASGSAPACCQAQTPASCANAGGACQASCTATQQALSAIACPATQVCCEEKPALTAPAMCRNNICENGETGASCPWDCKIASSQKQVRIQYPAYSTSKAIQYRIDGTIQQITDTDQLLAFMRQRIDLSAGGTVIRPSPYASYLLNATPTPMVTLPYLQLDSVWGSGDQPYLWSAVKDNETLFVHNQNTPPTIDSRLRYRCTANLFLTYPTTTWQQAYITEAKRNLAVDPQSDGIFMDETFGKFTSNGRLWHVVRNVPLVVGPDGVTITIPDGNLQVPEQYYPCVNDINAFDNATGTGTNYFAGGTNTATTITLGTALPAGSTAYVSYWKIGNPGAPIINSWTADTVAAVNQIHTALGEKLLIYNGIIYSWSEDNQFPSVSDGGMDEQFVATPWSGTPANYNLGQWLSQPASASSTNWWKKQLDELNTISKTRAYLAQGRLTLLDTQRLNASDPATALMKKIQTYAFSTFLLGKQRFAYYDFALDPGPYQTYAHFDEWETDLGAPLEEYHLRSGTNSVYQRDYAKVLVLVNPSATPETVSLGQTYYTLTGTAVTQATMDAPSGMILKKNP